MEPRPPSRRVAWRSTLLVVLGLAAVWGVAGGFLLPFVAKRAIVREGGERLGRPVSVERVSVNPYTLEAAVEGFAVLEADGKTPFVTFDRLDLDASATSVYRLAPVIDRLTLSGLKAHLVRDAENHYNVTDIVERLAAAAKAHAAETRARHDGPEEPARFSVSNVRLVNASVDFDDRPMGRRHEVSEIHLSVPFISNLPGHLKEYVQPSLAAKVNGAPLLVTGETQPFQDTLRTHFTLDLNALEIPRYLAYVPASIPVRVDSGVLDAHVTVSFTQGRAGKQPSIEAAGMAALSDVAVSGANGELLRTGRLEARLGSFDLLAGKARVDEVRIRDARGLGGDLRVAEALASGIDLDLRGRSARIAQVSTRDGAVSLKRGRDGEFELPQLRAVAAEAPAGQPASAAWKVAIDRATLSGYQVTFVDSGVRPAITHRVKLASVEATDLVNEEGFRGKAVAKIGLDRGGSLDVDSSFALEPLQVTAKIDARGLDLVPLRPYMTQFATVALRSGAASARGELSLKGGARGLRVGYTGGAEVARFSAYDTTAREELLSFRSVRTSGIDFGWAPDAPLALAVGEILVDKVYSRIVVHPDGQLNLQQLRTAAPGEPAAAPQPAAPARPRNVRIDRIAFVDGRLNFTDHFIKPNYSADVGGLQGSVTGLSSAPESRGTVDLKGSYDGASPVTIAGTVNPLRGDLFLDIAAKGKDIELPRLTAYSQRYAGYGIKEGKLTLDVKYHVEGGKLEGRNNITLDQLTFGDKVDSPDATQLPVLFAVNLLKDADGRIALELPISGSLDDPQFDVGALVGQLLGSLLKKAVTSPFSLLSAAFGGNAGGAAGDASQDLAFVDFAPGRSDLDATDVRKLETMVRALRGRPGLTLEMAALLDSKRDVEALRLAAMQKSLATDGKVPEGEAYVAALRAAYAKAKLPGNAAELTPAAMEAALLEKVEVGEAELATLKATRAQKVRAWLLEQGKLPAERVVLAEARADGASGEAGGTRVAFALR